MNFHRLLHRARTSFSLPSSSLFAETISSLTTSARTSLSIHYSSPFSLALSLLPDASIKPNSLSSSFLTHRFISSGSTQSENDRVEDPPPITDEDSEGGETSDGWEEEEEAEPEVGDGGDGGGVVLQGVPWGERALSIAYEALLQFGDDMKLYAFKTTPRGYVYVRLDKLSNKYGCPSIEELESYSQEYKKKLDEVGALGEIPDDLALEVSTPGAERIVKVPDDLNRFKDMVMRVSYVDDMDSNGIEKNSNGIEKNGVFLLDSIEMESESCVWKLAEVKENRDPLSKGRPLSRKRRDWRLNLPFVKHKRVTLYLEY